MNPLRLSNSQSTSSHNPLTAEFGESSFLTGPELPISVPIPMPVTLPGPAARECPCNHSSELLAVISSKTSSKGSPSWTMSLMLLVSVRVAGCCRIKGEKGENRSLEVLNSPSHRQGVLQGLSKQLRWPLPLGIHENLFILAKWQRSRFCVEPQTHQVSTGSFFFPTSQSYHHLQCGSTSTIQDA